jgi:RNA polymerase-binding protein DksA
VKSSYSKEELEHFKQILLKKREEILEMLEAHKQSLIEATTQNDKPVGTPYSIHMEYGTETEEREKTMFFIAREEKMLNYIDAALMRIERGTYGVCIKCGKLIDKRRLEAVPHTQLCIECKLAQKKGF